MYDVFTIPDNFLTHEYTEAEKKLYDANIASATKPGSSLNEAVNFLTQKQKDKVDDWYGTDRHIRERHDEVFGKDNDRITIPLDRSNEEPLNHNHLDSMGGFPGMLTRHLKDHGYTIKDYVKGLAVKTDEHEKNMAEGRPARHYSIGKIINKLPNRNGNPDSKFSDEISGLMNKKGKHMSVSDAYNADPMRASGKGDHVMVVTRNKYDVAGVSTNQNWSSCMNIVDGCNRRYLPKDIENGTLAVFLAHKDHETNDLKPLARISAKLHTSDDGLEHQFVPENRYYGNPHPTFKKAVGEFFEKHYPLGEKDYHMHPSLYADTGRTTIFKRNMQSLDTEESGRHLRLLAGRHIDVIDNIARGDYDHKGQDYFEAYHDAMETAQHQVKMRMDKMEDGAVFRAAAKATLEHETDHHYGRFERIEDTDHDRHTKDQLIASVYHDEYDNSDMSNAAKKLKTNELLSLHNEFHDKLEDAGEYSRKMYSHIHDALVDKIHESNIDKDQTQEQSTHHDNVLHTLTESIKKHSDAVDDAYIEHDFVPFNGKHPALLSNNPRTIHSMIDDSEEIAHGSRYTDKHDDMGEDDKHEIAYHIGKHADEKLAHHYHNSLEIGDQKYDSFVKGLNENPNGERIQHSLTHRMYFGNTSHSMPNPRYERKVHFNDGETQKKAFSVNDPEHVSVRDGDLFNAIATHSTKLSVLHSLIGRHDVDDEVKKNAREQIPFATTHKRNFKEDYSVRDFDSTFRKVLKESLDVEDMISNKEPEPNEKTGTMYDNLVKRISGYFSGEKKEVEVEEDDSEVPTRTNYTQNGFYKTQDNALDTADYIEEAVKKSKKSEKKEDAPKPNQIIINPDESQI
jgi:hypothetical protein